MDAEYRITVAGDGQMGQRDLVGPPRLLKVELGDQVLLYFGSAMTRQASAGFRDLSVDELRLLLVASGIEELERGLRAGIYPPDDGDYVERAFASEDYDHLRAVLEREKECVWQDRQPRGYICRATPSGSDARTTTALCSGCLIPDARTLCAHLMHPSIHAVRDETGDRRVPNLSPLCNAGYDPGVGADCFLGGKDCAERRVPVSEPTGEPPIDVARRAADEIDYFTLVWRDRFASRVWTIPQARTISELFGECEDAEDFQRRMAALADLLARLNPYEQLDEAERVDEAGNRVGSLVALERFVTRERPEALPAVRTLRLIAGARNSFPIHTRSDQLLETFRALGVKFPARDWHYAWLQMLSAFWRSVRALRTAMQTEPSRS